MAVQEQYNINEAIFGRTKGATQTVLHADSCNIFWKQLLPINSFSKCAVLLLSLWLFVLIVLRSCGLEPADCRDTLAFASIWP